MDLYEFFKHDRAEYNYVRAKALGMVAAAILAVSALMLVMK